MVFTATDALLKMTFAPHPDLFHDAIRSRVLGLAGGMDFLVSGPSSAQLLQFQLSIEARQRASELLQKDRDQGLTPAESQELDFYVELGDFLGILRAKAQLQNQNLTRS